MRRWLLLLVLLFPALAAQAQTDDVREGELGLTVTVEEGTAPPFAGELVLVTIHGRYTRHVTRETLVQPPLDDFSWMQLGYDHWYETTDRGRKVKNFRRRMALFPERAGQLTIPPIIHRLDLIGGDNKWFTHEVRSKPVTLEVLPAPVAPEDWLPLRRLEIADQWSNPPDQLEAGAGVLRVIRVEATGIAPEMLPPMPELRSPSGSVFPHPEARMAELSPEGPVAIAYWRWTIRPNGPVSAILEPMTLGYFDTVTREHREVTISATRVAYDAAQLPVAEAGAPPVAGEDRQGTMAAALAAGLVAGLAVVAGGLMSRRPAELLAHLQLRLELWRSARRGDLHALRRSATGLDRRADPDAARASLLASLDRAIFARPDARHGGGFDARGFHRSFVARLGPHSS